MQISNTVEIQSDSDDNIIYPETHTKPRKQKNCDKRPARVNKDTDRSIRQNSLNSATSNKSNVQIRVIEDGTSKANSSDQHLEANGHTNADPNNAARIIIAGDSMIKNLNGFKLSSRNSRVQVSIFPGCSTLDMEDQIKPILWKKPDKSVIHVGTNILRTAYEIANFAKSVLSSSPETTVALSSIIQLR